MRLLLILLGAAVASVSAASGPVSESAVRSTSASRPRLGSSPSSLTSLPRKRHAAAGAAARAAAGAEADGVDVECGAARRACKPASLRGGRLTPSFAFAVLHNWLYFLSLGLTSPVLPRIISTIANADGSSAATAVSVKVAADVEGVDKLLTFLCVGFLGSLSDVVGRKPLMMYSSLGFGLTCLLQASTTNRLSTLYLADIVDGVSSCMSGVCQAYVADASDPASRAINLGIFQGISIAGAFIVGIPISAILSQKVGLRAPVYLAAAVQVLNFGLIALVTPESNPASARKGRRLNLREANPLGALRLLFGRAPLLRGAACTYCFIWLANCCLNSLFNDYVNYRFGWGPAQAGPLLVVVGLMLAITPRLLVPRLGLQRAIQLGSLVFAAGQLANGLAPTPRLFFLGICITALGTVCLPATVAFIANLAGEGERGALLGGLSTTQELCSALALFSYGRVFSYAISDKAPFNLPGLPFILSAAFLLVACGVITHTLSGANASTAALFKVRDDSE